MRSFEKYCTVLFILSANVRRSNWPRRHSSWLCTRLVQRRVLAPSHPVLFMRREYVGSPSRLREHELVRWPICRKLSCDISWVSSPVDDARGSRVLARQPRHVTYSIVGDSIIFGASTTTNRNSLFLLHSNFFWKFDDLFYCDFLFNYKEFFIQQSEKRIDDSL